MQPTPPVRPGTVFIGAYLYAGVCALLATVVVASMWAIPEYSRYNAATSEATNAGTAAALAMAFFAVCALIWGMVSLILAYFAGTGRRAARILTWIAAGITLLFCGLLVYKGIAPIPWYNRLNLGLNLTMMALSATSIVLLALPSSSRYYRETRAAKLARRAAQQRFVPPPTYYPAAPMPYSPVPPPGSVHDQRHFPAPEAPDERREQPHDPYQR
jgi:hypothetical protein